MDLLNQYLGLIKANSAVRRPHVLEVLNKFQLFRSMLVLYRYIYRDILGVLRETTNSSKLGLSEGFPGSTLWVSGGLERGFPTSLGYLSWGGGLIKEFTNINWTQ